MTSGRISVVEAAATLILAELEAANCGMQFVPFDVLQMRVSGCAKEFVGTHKSAHNISRNIRIIKILTTEA